jgi:hypothetical protein
MHLELLSGSSETSGFTPLDGGVLEVSLLQSLLAGGDEIGW